MPADDSKTPDHSPAPGPAAYPQDADAQTVDIQPLDKPSLRAVLRARRRACAPACGSPQATQLGEQLADVLERAVDWTQVRATAVYAAVGHELDPAPLSLRLRARGIRTCYPRVASKNPPQLVFVAVADEHELAAAPFGLREPASDAPPEPLSEIDVFIVPGLGFDDHGHRLGQGRAYYDHALHQHPTALRIGVCHSCQQLSAVPHEPHDEGMDLVVTPTSCLAPMIRTRHRLQRDAGLQRPEGPSAIVANGTARQPPEVKP